jgi:hypothetical protein
VKCGNKLALTRLSQAQDNLVAVGNNVGNKLHLSDRSSQEQDNLVKNANVGRDLTFAPVQNIIETQII